MTENGVISMKLYPHQQKLINKTREAFSQGYKAPCVVSPCGSGKSVMISEIIKLMTDNKKQVLFLVHRQELKDQIANTLKKFNVNMLFVNLGMVQTIVKKLDRIKKPELIITDEAHHSLANSYKKIYDYFYDVLRLNFTATPVRLNGDGLEDVNDILIAGESVKWLIDNHFLSPYKYYAPKIINTDLLKVRRGEYTNQSINEIYTDKKIYGDVVGHYKKLANNEQAICYCYSIEQSIEVASLFSAQNIKSAHIDGTTPKFERQQIIKKFRDEEIKILCNVDLIGEGFDVPDCSTVIMLRPTQSLSLYIQQSMRGMRYKEDKLSKIIDHVGNIERFGFPDSERDWSLTKKEKATKRKKEENTIKITTCTNCFAVFEKEKTECPFCNFKVEKQERKELEVLEQEELQEVKNIFQIDFRTIEDCHSYSDLLELAKNLGYKKGWAYHQAKIKGFIK